MPTTGSVKHQHKAGCITGNCKYFCARLLISGLLLLFVFIPVVAHCQEPEKYLASQDAVILANPDGQILRSWNANKPLVPASILKLLTVLTVFHYLGPDYHFATEFYLTPERDLVIKGYGDPLLISEVVAQATSKLAQKIPAVSNLFLDDTFFAQPIIVPGSGTSSQPYDAPLGALCVNFNTVNFKTENGHLVSAESQTPLLPFAIEKIRRQAIGSGRITLSNNSRDILAYAGQMFAYFLTKQGVKISGSIKAKPTFLHLQKPWFTFYSPFSISDAATKLLTYSNNFIANQLLLAAAGKIYGPPATMEKAVRLLNSYTKQVCRLNNVQLVEGSGISRQNRISAMSMLKVLELFRPYHRLLRYDPAKHQFYKTGTLNGIRTRAGFMLDRKQRLWPFVIMGRRQDQLERIQKALAKIISSANKPSPIRNPQSFKELNK